ncbi:hypothetical protein NIZ92_06665 [Alcaligenes sp. 1735tsa3]|uniref:GDSL-type esterase/lipase family protein n=1 Tax=Alcaligenes sp. 1735tsa3 TaxID=2953809 RepID=UPI0020A7AAAE|nr:GDSL-type esterase/lipase family protein [Alcaligenes sp. 1735tsa3]USY26714.1 hypothetical protein NIZ92_06665 [Alcaligenes sp. 1735tsa3]
MTVSSEQSRVQYATDGVATSFPVPFRFLQNQDLRVTLVQGDGSERPLSLDVDYSVTGAGQQAGGTLTITDTPPPGQTLLIDRIVSITQETAYQRNDQFPERAHERALDKLTMICQQLASIFGMTSLGGRRVLMVRDSDGGIGYLPLRRHRVNHALGFDENGDPVAIPSDLPQLIGAVERAEAAADSAEEDAASTSVNAASAKVDAAKAEAAADAATVNSKVYPTPLDGLHAVGDGEYFLVIGANENQAARLYLRINSGDGRLQKIYPTLAAVESVSADVASLRTSVSGISSSISREGDLVFGRDSNPITGSNIPGGTYIYANPVPASGSVTSIRAFCKTPGDLRINIYQRTGNRVDRKLTTTRPLIAGLNEILFGENDIPVSNGEYLSFSCAAGVLSFTGAPGDEGGHYIFTNQDIETGNLGGITKSARLQFSATITGQVQIQVGEELDSLQEQINQLGPSTGAVATDSRTLFRYRARIGTLDATGAGQLNVLMLGDSWSEHARIPQQLRNVLENRCGGVAAYGWIDAIGGSPMQGLSYGRTGAWTTYSTATGGAVPAVGTGPDGRVVYTDTNDATAQITTTCESFKIYYRDTTGSFRWRVDGGAWTTVSGAGSGDIAVVKIDGLLHASHTFRLETVGNTGTVAILGYLASSSEPGVIVHKCGSGGSTGVSMQKHLNNLTPFVDDLSPDVAVLILGTNDYRTAGATVDQFRTAVNGVIDRLRSVIPDVGIILWAPAKSNGSEVTPLSSYVSAMSDIALNKNVEFFSNYASFGDFSYANALGMWLDALHQSPSGARSSVNFLSKTLLY